MLLKVVSYILIINEVNRFLNKLRRKEAIGVDLARVSSNGLIKIPDDILKKLKLKAGDKVSFREEDGNIIINNASYNALKEIQGEMKGKAEEQGILDEVDVKNLIKETRNELWSQKYESNN